MAQRDDNEMLQIKREKLEELKANGENPHLIEKFDVNIYTKEITDDYEGYEGKEVSVAGRVMAKRGHGKMNFMDLQDSKGQIQLLNRKNVMDINYDVIKKVDIGDIVGVTGVVTKTDTGQISIETKEMTLLTKSLAILPEKWHGLKDQETRYRKRYLDLIVNPDIKDVFVKRSKIISEVRKYLDNNGFLEVETPILNTIPGGANARPFVTHHNTLDIDMYLRIANELYLKRLIVGGFDKVYEIGRMFRNEGMDKSHNPEYTAIELYQAYTDYEGMMNLTEDLIYTVNMNVNATEDIVFDNHEISLKRPWKRATMTDLVKEYSGLDFNSISSDEEAVKLAKEHNIEVKDHLTKGDILAEFFDEYVEDNLIQPTIVYEYPVEISPLAKRNKDNPKMTNRFEIFMAGSEVGNAFSELNDADDQRQRFEKQVELREKGDDEAQMMDYDFVESLEVGLPPTGGLGIGIDRLVMLLTNQASIRDVLLFPTMKPLGLEKKELEEENSKETNEDIVEVNDIDFSKVKVEPLFEDTVTFDEFSKGDFRAVKVLNCEEVPKSKKLLKFILDDGSDSERVILSGIKENYNAEELIGKTLLAIVNLPPRKMMGIDSEGMIISAIHEEEGEEKLNLIMLDQKIPAGAKMY